MPSEAHSSDVPSRHRVRLTLYYRAGSGFRTVVLNLIIPAVIQTLVEGQPLLPPGFVSSGQGQLYHGPCVSSHGQIKRGKMLKTGRHFGTRNTTPTKVLMLMLLKHSSIVYMTKSSQSSVRARSCSLWAPQCKCLRLRLCILHINFLWPVAYGWIQFLN